MVHTITVLTPVHGLISTELAALITPCVTYKTVFYKPGFHHKKRIESQKSSLIRTKGGFFFYAGLLDSILAFCKTKGIEITVIDRSQEKYEMWEPELKGITFRSDQITLLNAWLDKPRGILKSPTGSGKTVLGLACISSFDDINIIWLCHTKDLMKQAYDDAVSFGHKSIGRIGNSFCETGKRLTIATRQSFREIADSQGDHYDMVVVDETHHVSSFDGEYHYILSRLLAPLRLGLTASDLKEGLPTMAVTGLIGPMISELSIPEAIELGILAIPKMKMLKTPVDHDIKNLRKYADVVELGIVHNLVRNRLIAATAKKHTDIDETVLIMVNQLEHGDNILAALKEIGVDAILVEGLTKSSDRDKIKKALNEKHIKCVICSTVWKEGINIPSLNVVILACGGKDPLQALGRGLRKTAEKDTLYYYDIFDPSNRYLIEHFGIRLCFYMENGWL